MESTTAPRRWVVWSRPDCSLCDDFIEQLAACLAPRQLAFEVCDVDEDPLTQRRFGMKIPVLTLDGRLICHGRLDATAVEKLLIR